MLGLRGWAPPVLLAVPCLRRCRRRACTPTSRRVTWPCFPCLPLPPSHPTAVPLQAYRAACHYGDSEEEVEEGMRLASSAVYNKLMLFVLVRARGGRGLAPAAAAAAGFWCR